MKLKLYNINNCTLLKRFSKTYLIGLSNENSFCKHNTNICLFSDNHKYFFSILFSPFFSILFSPLKTIFYTSTLRNFALQLSSAETIICSPTNHTCVVLITRTIHKCHYTFCSPSLLLLFWLM